MSSRVEPILTVADLDAMPDDDNRYELIEGELFVSRAPGLNHQRILSNLLVAIRTYLDRHPIGEVVPGPGVIFSEISAVIPDLLFMSYENRDRIVLADRIKGAPDLVIEILSPGAENSRRDRIAKRRLYGKYAVREYWLVDPETRNIEVYSLHGETMRLLAGYSDSQELISDLLPGFVCRVESIFRV
jgi:Uma2 family endonuclease